MTMHYTHVGDHEIEATAERVGQAISSMTGEWQSGWPNLPANASNMPVLSGFPRS